MLGRLYGQEKNQTTSAIARMNLFLHGAEDFRIDRFPGWQSTKAGEREVQKALRKVIYVKYRIKDQDLFDRAYGYIRQYY